LDQAELVPQKAERQQQIGAMNNSGKTRAQALLDLIETVEFQTREYDRSFVLMQYFGLLRRDPNQGGYDFWLNILNNREPNNYRSMVCGFHNLGGVSAALWNHRHAYQCRLRNELA
jgi:hypothetical protein